MSPFSLLDASSAAEAVALLQTHGSHAKLIAAGGDLLGLLKEGVRGAALPPPKVVVNLATAHELHRIERTREGWSLGAMATLTTIACTTGLPPILAEAISHIASPQLRARTTLGGNLLQRPRCLYFRHPDESCFKKGGVGCPAIGGPLQAYPGALMSGACHAGHPSDLAPVLIVLQASAELLGPSGIRHVRLSDFYSDAILRADSEAAIGHDEVLVSLHIPDTTLAQAFEKIAPRDANEFATASAAATGAVKEGRWKTLNIALAGVAPEPLRLVTDAVIGRLANPQSDEVFASTLLPAPASAPLNARLSEAQLAVERVLCRIRRPLS
jgi:xanthine dehydrogenase YagS FAD-binding subunit